MGAEQAPSHGLLAASRSWERRGADAPLELAQPCDTSEFGFPASQAVRKFLFS